VKYGLTREMKPRFFATIPTCHGGERRKGFTNKTRAMRRLAKEEIYDEVFGVREEIDVDTDFEGGSATLWLRPGAFNITREQFAEKMREHFNCARTFDRYGYPSCECNDDSGWCRSKFNKRIDEIVEQAKKDGKWEAHK